MATPRITRRSVLKLSGGALLAGVLAACAAPSAPTPAPTQAPAAAAPKPAEPTAASKAAEPTKPVEAAKPAEATKPAVAAAAPAQGAAASGTIELYFPRVKICRLCGAVDDWNAKNPNAKVVDKDIPWPYEKQVAALAAGQGGPDLYQDEPANVLRDGLNGKLLDFTGLVEPIKDNYLAYKVEQFRLPTGKIYAVPWQVGITVEIYRDDILKKLGMTEFPAGWTWEQHEQLAEKAKKDLNVNTGWIGPGKASDVPIYGQMLWQAGGTFVSKDWRTVELDSPISVEVVKRIKRMWTKGLLFEGSSYTPPLWGAMREGILWSTTDPSWWLLGMRD